MAHPFVTSDCDFYPDAMSLAGTHVVTDSPSTAQIHCNCEPLHCESPNCESPKAASHYYESLDCESPRAPTAGLSAGLLDISSSLQYSRFTAPLPPHCLLSGHCPTLGSADELLADCTALLWPTGVTALLCPTGTICGKGEEVAW